MKEFRSPRWTMDFAGSSFLLEIEDGVIQRVNHVFGAPDSMGVVDAFVAWLAANHPEDVALMFVASVSGGDQFASLSPESIALWDSHLDEYIAEQAG